MPPVTRDSPLVITFSLGNCEYPMVSARAPLRRADSYMGQENTFVRHLPYCPPPPEFEYVVLSRGALLALHPSTTSSSALRTGKLRNNTVSTRLNTAVFAPMPMASDAIATAVNTGVRPSTRMPYRTSRARFSMVFNPRASRHSSRKCSTPPNSRRAARPASVAPNPRARFFSASIARWKLSSSSSSLSTRRRETSARSRIARSFQPMSCLVSCLFQHPPDRHRQPRPRFRLHAELLAPRCRQFVKPRAPPHLRSAPFRRDPPLVLQTVQRRIERSLVDPQHIPRNLLDGLGDGPPVLRPGLRSEENQQIERALQQVEFHVVVGCLQQKYAPAFSKCQYVA